MKSVGGLLLCLALQATAATPIVPKIELSFWNGDHQEDNNCYNYATNRATNSFAQPGETAGVYSFDLECEATMEAVALDKGITKTEFFPFLSKQDDTLIALVVAPGEDYHWYRRGDDGKWSHKMGGTRATTKDNSGQEILDPKNADRGDYIDFCGYFKVTNFQYDETQQNGGYVMIGDMNKMPKLPGEKSGKKPKSALESTVTVDMYSGRRNPEVPLRDVLANENLRKLLTTQVVECSHKTMSVEPQHLGYRGVVINDREGLMFEKGAVIRLQPGAQSVGVGCNPNRAEEALKNFILQLAK